MQRGIHPSRHKLGYIAAITSSRANHRGADRAEFTAGREQNRFNTAHSLIEELKDFLAAHKLSAKAVPTENYRLIQIRKEKLPD